ncbi:MAG: type I-E CRISPR-associated protein Cas6/Cse3/CasE [Treponema sp.]|jgi:CRISPR system Cascade subunit CasE|nr:type I-E CRISPR-associated protein Cas6/Cse3/CasE [Treponema sp.]
MIASVLHLSREDFQIIKNENNGVFDTYTIHKLVYSLFPQENETTRTFLFLYKGGNFQEKRIILLSKNKPKKPNIGFLESKEIPAAFLDQDYYGFEVQINPVRCDSKTKKLIPIKGKQEIARWFSEKSSSFGFEILPASLSISDTDVVQFDKKDKKVVLAKAVCTGRLKVTNRSLFIKSFENGLGRGKAFGFGLLQIVPLYNA